MNASSYVPGRIGGNREDLRGPLTLLEPEETPFTSMIKKEAAPKSTLVEVVADTLDGVRIMGTPEGSDGSIGGNKAVNRARFGSYLHRWHRTYGVTDVQQDISVAGGVAGVDNEFNNSRAKALRELKRDMEASHLSGNDTVGGGADAMRERGVFKWLDATQTPAIPPLYQCPATQRRTGVTDLQESGVAAGSVNEVLKSLITQYGGPQTFTFLCGNDYAEDVDLFTRTHSGAEADTSKRYRVNENGTNMTITLHVKTFRSTFGVLNIVVDQFLRCADGARIGDPKSGFIFSERYWSMLMLEELFSAEDPESAGGRTGYCKAIGASMCRMPRGNASIINV
jgi:Family of unknown function (DUF5309)